MLILRIPAPKAVVQITAQVPLKPRLQWRLFQLGSPHLRLTRPQSQLRSFAHHPSRSNASEAMKRQARSAAPSDKNYEIPERLIIYHAGTGRIAFLAMLKLTSLLLGAFFTLLVVPSYIQAEKPPLETAAVKPVSQV
ncbi:hypothetical protein J3459_015800 [Metarhizium acridum]|nr:hypothetical protein J3459_015800 [Metarhizium acridum]